MTKDKLIKYVDSLLEIEIFDNKYFERMSTNEILEYIAKKKYSKEYEDWECQQEYARKKKVEEEAQTLNLSADEVPSDRFDLAKVKNMGILEARKAIDKHFIILDNGDHALIGGDEIKIYDTKTIKSTFFNRLPSELQNYYFKEKLGIRTPICDIHKPFLTPTEINMSKKMKHKYVKYSTFSEKTRKAVDRMISYMKEVLCNNRDDILYHLLKLEANMVRGIKNDCCIYLKGPQGCGKSTHPEFLRIYVMGEDLSVESGSAPLKNRFNAELKGRVMVIFEELENFGPSEWLSISSTLKRWITSPTMQIEGKNKDVITVINIITFWLLSNNDAIQDDDGRRYFILPVSTKYTDDRHYWDELRSMCFNNEVGHAYYCYLMELDLTGFKPQQYPVTTSKLDSYAKRLDTVYRFLKDCFILKNEGIAKMSVGDLHEFYQEYCKQEQIKSKGKIDFNKTLEEVGIQRNKSNDTTFYNVTWKELKAIADKKHWIYELDASKSKYKVNEKNDPYNKGVTKETFGVKHVLQSEHDELKSKYEELLKILSEKKPKKAEKTEPVQKIVDTDSEDEKPIKKRRLRSLH